MADLIERQAAIDAVRCGMLSAATIYGRSDEGMTARKEIERVISELPSAQPEIIRCNDCAKRVNCRTSNVWAVAPGGDWYCADAERKKDC